MFFKIRLFSDTLSFIERMRNMSEGSAYTDDEDDDGSHHNFGGFTSTVCVNFSQDDLRFIMRILHS
jgi:hypothetical protein